MLQREVLDSKSEPALLDLGGRDRDTLCFERTNRASTVREERNDGFLFMSPVSTPDWKPCGHKHGEELLKDSFLGSKQSSLMFVKREKRDGTFQSLHRWDARRPARFLKYKDTKTRVRRAFCHEYSQ